MRTVFMALLASVSIQAFACPNLSGSFTCTYQDGSSEVVNLSQEQKDGVTIFTYNNSSVPADNKVYQIPDDESLREGTFRAWCDDEVTLKSQVIGKYYDQGQFYGDLTFNMNYSIENNNLKMSNNGTLKNQGGESPFANETVCTRNGF